MMLNKHDPIPANAGKRCCRKVRLPPFGFIVALYPAGVVEKAELQQLWRLRDAVAPFVYPRHRVVMFSNMGNAVVVGERA